MRIGGPLPASVTTLAGPNGRGKRCSLDPQSGSGSSHRHSAAVRTSRNEHSTIIEKESTLSDMITVIGFVATELRQTLTGDALPITSFRLASNQRRFDRATSAWVEMETNWYTVTAFRQLALNANTSIRKGERVIVSGRLRVRNWDTGTRKGTAVEIDADTIGHDLTWGTASFTKNSPAAGSRSTVPIGEDPSADEPGAHDTGNQDAPGHDESSPTEERSEEEPAPTSEEAAMALAPPPF